jgi:hypothetical protein
MQDTITYPRSPEMELVFALCEAIDKARKAIAAGKPAHADIELEYAQTNLVPDSFEARPDQQHYMLTPQYKLASAVKYLERVRAYTCDAARRLDAGAALGFHDLLEIEQAAREGIIKTDTEPKQRSLIPSRIPAR